MSANEPETIESGKFKLTLSPAPTPLRLANAELALSLDQPGMLTVTLAMLPTEIAKLSHSACATEASLSWADNALFKGHLLQVEFPKPAQVRFQYRDLLFATKKISENSFVQEHSLRECLTKFTQKVGLNAQFYGNFSSALPSFNLSGNSIFDHLVSLSHQFGFHFVANSAASEIAFIKLGQQVKSRLLDGAKHLGSIQHSQSAEHTYAKSHLRHFDPKSMQAQDRKMGDSDLYGPLGDFKGHGGFKSRAGWKLAEGALETHIADGFHFEASEQLIRNQLSKAAMGQESLSVGGFTYLGHPGDKVTVKGAPAGDIQNGDYLIGSLRVNITSAIPKGSWELLRA